MTWSRQEVEREVVSQRGDEVGVALALLPRDASAGTPVLPFSKAESGGTDESPGHEDVAVLPDVVAAGVRPGRSR